MLSALLLGLTVAAAQAAAPVQPWLDAYDGQHETGNMITYHDSSSSLGHWNDRIRSACINGLWVFFEHDQYNYDAGRVIWSYGFNYCFTFKSDFDSQISSFRRVGDYYDASADSLSLYEGTYYSGKQVFTKTSLTNIGTSYGYQSVIVTGPDAWTIYLGTSFSGPSVCLYSGGDSAVSPTGQKLEYGLFPTADYLGVVGSNIRSAQKGCYSSVVLRGRPLPAAERLRALAAEQNAVEQDAVEQNAVEQNATEQDAVEQDAARQGTGAAGTN